MVSRPPEQIVTQTAPITQMHGGGYIFSEHTGAPIAGILSIDEGAYVDGRWVPGRRLNGDENGQGKFMRIGGGRSRNGSIQRVKLYRYR